MNETKKENQCEKGTKGTKQLQYNANPLRSHKHAETKEQSTDLLPLQFDGNGGFPLCDGTRDTYWMMRQRMR